MKGEGKYTIPLDSGNLPPFLQTIKQRLEKKVIGQPRPIKRILRGITAFHAQLNDPKRPVGIFMFAGPSGSGKTYLAEELAHAYLGEPENKLSPLVKIDCGSLSLEHTVASLTGSPPGYVGYGDRINLEMVGEYDKKKRAGDFEKKCEEAVRKLAKELTKRNLPQDVAREHVKNFRESIARIKKKTEELLAPFRSVVLFDEIEKANMNIQSQLLRILDEGKLDLLNGRQVDFRGSIIILTTNVGTEQIISEHLNEEKIGFSLPHRDKLERVKSLDDDIYRRVWREIFDRKKRHFKPELLARIGKPGIIVFHVLGHQDYQKILDLQLEEFQNLLLQKNGPGRLFVSYTPKFRDFLIEEGVSPIFGARALRSVIDKYVKTPVSEKILQKQLKIGDRIFLDISGGSTIISRQQRPGNAVPRDFRIKEFEALAMPQIDDALNNLLEGFVREIELRSKARG